MNEITFICPPHFGHLRVSTSHTFLRRAAHGCLLQREHDEWGQIKISVPYGVMQFNGWLKVSVYCGSAGSLSVEIRTEKVLDTDSSRIGREYIVFVRNVKIGQYILSNIEYKACGIEKAVGREGMGKLVAAIGESTFVHSGITGLIDMVYNGNTETVMIMDNSLTAMTGGQENPTTGKNLRGEPAPVLNLEKMESLRWSHYLAPHGKLVVCDLEITPMTVNTGHAEYPDVNEIIEKENLPVTLIQAVEIAEELGNLRVVNVVLIGAVSTHLPIDEVHWKKAIEERVPPKALEVNLEAFLKGQGTLR